MTALLWYLLFINIVSALVCIADKLKSRKGARRISEKTLLILSALGGGAAMFVTMLVIRHKTKHLKFMLGIPLIIASQCVLTFLLFNTFC